MNKESLQDKDPKPLTKPLVPLPDLSCINHEQKKKPKITLRNITYKQ